MYSFASEDKGRISFLSDWGKNQELLDLHIILPHSGINCPNVLNKTWKRNRSLRGRVLWSTDIVRVPKLDGGHHDPHWCGEFTWKRCLNKCEVPRGWLHRVTRSGVLCSSSSFGLKEQLCMSTGLHWEQLKWIIPLPVIASVKPHIKSRRSKKCNKVGGLDENGRIKEDCSQSRVRPDKI